MDEMTVVSIGEILVEFVSHRVGCGLSEVSEYSGPYPSGAPAIFVDQAARMGAPAQMIGGVGQDAFGKSVLARLAQNGVGTKGVTVNPDLTTGVAFVSYYEDGSRSFVFHLEGTAADHFSLPSGIFDPAHSYLHVSAASLGIAAMREMILSAVRDVTRAGGKISCDPNARPELMRDTAVRDALAGIMEVSTCLLPSTSDLKYLFPDLTEDAAIDRLLTAKTEVIALKRGAGGATIVGGAEQFNFAGHHVTEVDPTGAGDCFGGTFIALLSRGADLRSAGEMANAAGALAVTRRGPMEGNSSPDEIVAFLKQAASAENR